MNYWVEFNKSKELTYHIMENYPGAVLKDIEWYGPGWYFISPYKKGEYWFITTRYANNRANDLKEQIRELAKQLVQARLKEKESVYEGSR